MLNGLGDSPDTVRRNAMGTASCESLLSPLLSSGLLRLGMYVPVLPSRLLFLHNATRPGLGPRPKDEGY